MSKRNMFITIICIVVAFASFWGGTLYGYEEFKGVKVDYDILKSKYDAIYTMPLNRRLFDDLLNLAIYYHEYHVDNEILLGKNVIGVEYELKPLEYHQAYINLYESMRTLRWRVEEKWGVYE